MDNCEKNKMLPEKLKQLREASGLPQRKVAAVLDIDTATYSKIENGKFIPSKEQILQIAKIFSANESELLEMRMAEKIVAIAENYPELKSSENFSQLSKDLTKIEDEIANSRKYYNGTVRIYNNKIQMFPNSIIAKIFGFKESKMFEANIEEKK